MEIEFPVEFVVNGTPVSYNSKNQLIKAEWKQRIRDASRTALPDPHFATEGNVAIVLYYFPAERMQGDLDNIVKPILDALKQHVIVDDNQVERIVAQKFEPEKMAKLHPTASDALRKAWNAQRPLLYIRIYDKIEEEVS